MSEPSARTVRAAGNQSVVHLSWWEADAWARWAGRRLATEVEWEIAAHTAGRRGFRWADVHEWTAGTLQSWPGFSPDPWSGGTVFDPRPGFGRARVLRGASFATRARLRSLKRRSFAPADRDDDAIPYRTLPGVSPKGAYFTRGSGHNQYGAYTEDSAEYQVVLDRLRRKFSTAARYVPKPEIVGQGDNKIGIVSVGSCDGAVREAIDVLARQKIPVDYMRIKAFPFGHDVESFLSLHATIFVVEQNRDAQLRALLTLETGVDKSKLKSILSYSGFPMSCEPIVDGVRATLPDAPRLTAITGKQTR